MPRNYQLEYYYRNKDKEEYKRKAYLRRKKRANAKYKDVNAYKEKHGCQDCGETDPVVLEFDHIRGDKVSDVSRLIQTNASIKAIWEEIAKCEVVCANCHKRRTARRIKERQLQYGM